LSGETTSFPLRVRSAPRTLGVIELFKKRIEPSAIRTLNPLLWYPWWLPRPLSGRAVSRGRSSGLVQGTRRRGVGGGERGVWSGGDVLKGQKLEVRGEGRGGTDDGLVAGRPRFAGGVTGAAVDERHLVELGEVVGAVPGFVEAEF